MMAQRHFKADTIGDGAARVFGAAANRGPSEGRVVGVFSSGFYIQAGRMLFATGGPEIPAGPIHLVLKTTPALPPEKSVVHLGPDRLWTESCTIDISSASRYQPSQPTPAQLRMIAPVLARLNGPEAVPDDVLHVWPAVEDALERECLNEAKTLLEGLGGGLTPTGDDVLAGLLLHSHWDDPTSDIPGDLARRAVTTELSRCFLGWAAAGQIIKPVCDLIDAACQITSSANPTIVKAAQEKFDHSVRRVESIGRSSGKAILAGIGLAAVVQLGLNGSTRAKKLPDSTLATYANAWPLF